MSDLGLAIDEARSEIASAASEFMPDLCTIKSPTNSVDNAGGWTTVLSTIEASVPCEYRALNAHEQVSGDAVKAISTHEIKLPATANTLAIDGTYQIAVAARSPNPALNFRVTGILPASTNLFVYLGATLGD